MSFQNCLNQASTNKFAYLSCWLYFFQRISCTLKSHTQELAFWSFHSFYNWKSHPFSLERKLLLFFKLQAFFVRKVFTPYQFIQRYLCILTKLVNYLYVESGSFHVRSKNTCFTFKVFRIVYSIQSELSSSLILTWIKLLHMKLGCRINQTKI